MGRALTYLETMKAMTRSEREELISGIAATPSTIQRLIEGLDPNETRWKPESGDFSVVENICHLRDIEVEGFSVRITRILSEDDPSLADIDGAKLAVDRNYNDQDLASALDTFTKTREDNMRVIRGLTIEEFARTAKFGSDTPITLERLLEMMREHDEVHMRELSELIAERA